MRAIVAADCESTSLAWDREAWEVALCRRDDTGTKEIQFFLPVDLSKADPTALRIGGHHHAGPDLGGICVGCACGVRT